MGNSMNLGEIGYWLAVGSYGLLTALLFTAPLSSLSARLIRMFSALVVLWALANVAMLGGMGLPLVVVLSIELGRNLVLQGALMALLRGPKQWRALLFAPFMRAALGLALIPLLVLVVVGLESNWCRMLIFGGILGQVLLTLFLVEQNFRLLPAHARRPFLPFMVGVGAVLVFDFVLYAEGLLLLTLNSNFWDARGFIWGCAMPALLLTTRRLPSLGVKVFVSRQVVYHSTLLLVAGGYLLVMAAAGYYIRYFGGDWGKVMQIAFMALATALLAAIFFSEAFRRKVKVFIFKNFYANRYDYRVEWLKLNDILHNRSLDERVYLTALRAMAAVARAPCGYLFRRQGEGYTQRASFPEDQPSVFTTAQLVDLFAFCERESWIVDVAEFHAHPSRYRRLTLDVELCRQEGIALFVPIYAGTAVIGLFALGRHPEDPPINFEDRDLFNTVSSQLATYLDLEEANEALTEARQFDAFNRMSAFLLHDLKNIVAQLNLIVLNSKKHKGNPEFIDDSLDTLANAVSKMQRIMQQLKKTDGQPSTVGAPIDLAALLRQAVARQKMLQPEPQLRIGTELRVRADGERLLAVLGNLIQNAQEATAADKAVTVSLNEVAGMAEIVIEDQGIGMSEQFVRDRLFKPFDTTKGNAGMGIGAYEARQFITALDGSFDVDSREGVGTRITLRLPVHRE